MGKRYFAKGFTPWLYAIGNRLGKMLVWVEFPTKQARDNWLAKNDDGFEWKATVDSREWRLARVRDWGYNQTQYREQELGGIAKYQP